VARFFVNPSQLWAGQVVITGDDVRHITKVLRLGIGDQITVTTGENREYRVAITAASKTEVSGRVVAEQIVNRDPELKVTLVQGLPKGDKMDLIVQKCTELGVTTIIPVETKRAVVKLDAGKAKQRVERWQRIAMEAAKQCRRNRVPIVAPPTSWASALEIIPKAAITLVPWEDEQGKSLKQIMGERQQLWAKDAASRPQEVWVFIGPEGGLDPEEIELAKSKGVIPVSLGPRILRTETAGLAVLTMVLYQWGDLGGAG
jgi:16S rRNA (uracil1498-N3)-methyltransferase